MDYRYLVRLTAPSDALSAHIESRASDTADFDASLSLRRRALTRTSVRRIAACYPLATLRVPAVISAHGLALRLSGVPVQPHPAGWRG